MKKMLKIAAIALACVVSATTVALSKTYTEITRVDMLNYKGEIISSRNIYSEPYMITLFAIEKGDNGFNVSFNWENKGIASLRFVPWGTEKYPVNVTATDSNVKAWYEIVNEDGTTSEVTDNNILCGSTIRLHVECPDKAFPIAHERFLYSAIEKGSIPEYYEGLEISGSGVYNTIDEYMNPKYDRIDVSERKSVLEQAKGTGEFTKVDGEGNRWYTDIEMPNQPLDINVSYGYTDGSLLEDYTIVKLRNLYGSTSSNFSINIDGESFIQSVIGDYMSQDLISGCFVLEDTYTNDYLNFSFMDKDNYWVNLIPWSICFGEISAANLLLEVIDRFDLATQEERDAARAQMLTLRANGYWRLMQIYGPRWSDSNDGATLVAPLEITFNTENQAPASMREIADRCYADLDEAAAIFKRINFKRKHLIQPDLNVAKATKMRVAMLREDWATAEAISAELMSGLRLTTDKEMTAGFFKPTESWIWGASNFTEYDGERFNYVYWGSFQSWNACNGFNPSIKGFGPNAIDLRLYNELDSTDVRKTLYVMPGNVNWSYLKDDISHWYAKASLDPTNLFFKSTYAKNIRKQYLNTLPEGVEEGYTAFKYDNSDIPVQFGAQTKFYNPGSYESEAAVPFIRTEEVLLSHAEAAFHTGNTQKAINDLNTLYAARNSSKKASADDLLNRIRTERKLELWGEGHSWFDQKRWKLPIHRDSWVEKDITSGNWPAKVATDIPVDIYSGWRFAIPNLVKDANPLIDINKMGYQSVQSAPSRKGAAGKKATQTERGIRFKTVSEPESVLDTNPVVG